jgi:hypothetical protein
VDEGRPEIPAACVEQHAQAPSTDRNMVSLLRSLSPRCASHFAKEMERVTAFPSTTKHRSVVLHLKSWYVEYFALRFCLLGSNWRIF